MTTVKITVSILLAAAIFGVAYYFWGGAGAQNRKRPPAEALVVLEPVQMRQFHTRIEGIGTAQANEAVTIVAPVTERVEEILFKESEFVKAGQILVKLESDEEVAEVEAATITHRQQQTEFDRMRVLRDTKVVSQREMDTQTFLRDTAEARLNVAKAKLNERTIVAPFDGYVGLRLVSVGALVTPGEKITSLDDLATIKVNFSVPEVFLPQLKIGQEVNARSTAYQERTFTGHIRAINTRVDPVTRAVLVQSVFDNAELLLKPGMLLTVEITSQPRQSLSISEKAVLSFGRDNYVFVVGDDLIARRRTISIGLREYGKVEILSGLEAGERVIFEGILAAQDGQKVIIAQPKPEPAAGSDAKEPADAAL